MFGGNPFRFQNTEARTQAPRNVPPAYASQSSSSPASSLQPSAASSLLPAAPPFTSSQSDIVQSDHSSSRASSNSSSPKNRSFPLPIAPVPRSSSLAHMGQSLSRSDATPSAPSTPSTPPPLPLPAPASSRLRRAWVGRRKKSEDITAVFNNPPHSSDKGKAPEGRGFESSNPSVASVNDFESSLGMWRQKDVQQQLKSPKLGGSPPPPPPKPAELQSTKKSTTSSSSSPALPEQTSSPLVTSPGISAAIQFIHNQDDARTDKLNVPSPRIAGKSDAETKQDWRKSDSTMVSYATVRPGAIAGNRSPRPVSLAESSHSGHTIVPVNKRLSALIADPDFGPAEESDSDSEGEVSRAGVSERPSPAASIKTRNRRSASLNLGTAFGMWSTPPAVEAMKPSVSETGTAPVRRSVDQLRTPASASRDAPTLTKAAAKGIIAPSAAPGAVHSTGSSIRGRLAAWTAAASSSERHPPPPQHPHRVNPATNPGFRQTAVSMTGGFAPVAIGLGKRAAEKVHRVWGGLSSSASNYSAYSSTTSLSSVTPSTASGRYPDAVDRSASGQSTGNQSSCGGGWMRRTPNAPSGSWSVNTSLTSSSTSDTDAFAMPAGPSLGARLRGPRRNSAGVAVIGGLVFGRSLQQCVQDTAADHVKHVLAATTLTTQAGVKPLEERALPALVLRCAQHLKRWGLEEEGLFRITGRPSHVAKLRSEFDTGADYDLVQCGPGDLDPHAVASIFKAYLRELPESLLTDALSPRFEAALATQDGPNDTNSAASAPSPRVPTVPLVNPSPILRKPPSLSTLAMPSFAGMRVVSEAARRKLASLVAQLPPENKDLLYTVVELIQATAAHSKETKMPLGNLLLVLCPSLNMSPPLLRVLCEAKNLWDAPPPVDTADTSDAVSSQSPAPSSSAPAVRGQSGVILLDDTDSDSDLSDLPAARPRNGPRRGPTPGMLQVPDLGGISPYRSSGGSSGQDDAASYVSALDRSFSSPARVANDSSHNLPALSSSTDSLATPSTMSEVSSFQSSANVLTDDRSREKLEPIVTTLPVIASSADSPLPTSTRKPAISAPVPFPAAGSPRTPSSPRKSLALTSFPPFGRSEPSTPQSGSHTWTHRNKRPSLTLLFSKKSSSSLTSPQPSTKPDPGPYLAQDVSRHPTCFAPFASRTNLTISAPIPDAGPSPRAFASVKKDTNINSVMLAPSVLDNTVDEDTRARKDSSASSLFSTPQSMPIADFYRTDSASSLSLARGLETSRPFSDTKLGMHTSNSRSSLTPSIDINLEEDNWAQSVLLEAQAKSGAARSRLSVKEVVKKFEELS